ncbi:MAG: hypothetical protein HWD82_09410 [Flavobacteriaceae bacterium]|nr:hypothetical protein [Flavobacteriaceae bacterium]
MDNNTFLDILKNNLEVNQNHTLALKSIIDKYPFFQSARALYLKGLKNQDSFKYNRELKVTAAHTSDRTILFEYITSKKFKELKLVTFQVEQTTENESETKIKETVTNHEIVTEKIEKELEIGKPISFNAAENYSFNQWLQLSVKKPVVREEKPINKKEEIITQFIQNSPKIIPIPKDKTVTTNIPKLKQDSSLMTETLARVYLEQKKYENAIQAFKILSLKYPEKSGFFADQIKRVEILQKHKQ